MLADLDLRKNLFNGNPAADNLAKDPGSLLTGLLPNFFVVAAVIFLGIILLTGYNIISLAGSSDAKAAAKTKATLTYAVIGFLIVISAYFILQIVSNTLIGSNALIQPPNL